MALWSLKDKRILIVEDFPQMRSMLRGSLIGFGAQNIKEAKNGEEAIDALASGPIDIVLCDYNLGNGKDGQQVLEEAKYKNLLAYSSIFVITTAENTIEMVMGAVEYQPDSYLTKPFTKAVLQSRLMKLMEKKDSLAEISKALQKQDHLTAIKLCDKQLQNKPKNRLELLKLKGELLEILGDYDKAITLYEELLKERSILWASLGLGRIQYCQRHFEQAKAVFENLIKENAAFVTAYDWLAKTLEKLGDSKQSQKVLTEAVAKSPKTILRQRSLAEISFKNRDFDTSESAFKKAVRIGKNSCYKNPTDYTGLAKTLVEKDSPIEALKVVASIKQEFHENTGADLQAAVLEGMIYQRQDQREQCEKAINKALDHYSKQPDGLSHEVTMDLAKVCFSAGQKEKGHELIKQLICDHHENEDILSQAKQLYSDVGMEQEGNDLISLAYKEVVEINNRGVKLATEGKFEESIELFVKAAKAMPNNLTINLNAAQTLIMQMQKTNSSKSDPNLAGIYLDRVRTINPANEKLQKLTAILNTLKSN